jgi:hypothetical protein
VALFTARLRGRRDVRSWSISTVVTGRRFGRYELLNSWRAAHLQNSVWLADMASGTAQTMLTAMREHMHSDDTVCVIQLPDSGANWQSIHCRPEGVNWLKAHYP